MQFLVDFQRLSKVPAGSKGGNRCLIQDYVKLPTLVRQIYHCHLFILYSYYNGKMSGSALLLIHLSSIGG